MFFGAAYYPEHWPEERWPIDARLMQEAGINGVRLGEFAWSKIEPVEGAYDFEWLDKAIALLGVKPPGSSGTYIIRDEATISCFMAFTYTDSRGCGIAKALLDKALEWARSKDYERCAVDWEPQNIPVNRFLLKHFQPVCYSLIRHIDERIAWAHENQKHK